MAVNDPTPTVPTPTGGLRGYAGFSWDGATWQPSGAASASVATPTGVLRGGALFNWDGSAWQPSGRSGPGVPTPTGTLDGLAVFQWNGTAWTPTGGGASVPTSTGTLLGIAAFYWDGTAWQPSGQASPDVPTPYGVLQGAALFAWNGSTWAAATSGPSLTLDFTTGTLDSRITFTRANTGPATYFNSAGTLTTAVNNLCLNSSVFNSWPGKTDVVIADNNTTSPDGTTNAALVTEGVLGTANLSSAQATVAAGSTITFSVYVKRGNFDYYHFFGTDSGSANGFQCWVNLATGSLSSNSALGTATGISTVVTPLPNGWYRIATTCTFPGTSTVAQILSRSAAGPGSGSRVANGTYYIWGAQIEIGAAATTYIPTGAAANGAPRFDYDPVTHAALGLLIEEARTNLYVQSADFTNGTVASNVTTTANAAAAPDGMNTMTRAAEQAVTGAHALFRNAIPIVSGTNYTFALYAKMQQVQWIQLFFDDATNRVYATFDLSAGTVSQAVAASGTAVAVGASIQNVGGGIYRCSLTGNVQATTGRAGFYLANSGTPGMAPSYAGNTANGLLVWGGQLEAGAFPTSYVPTTAAAVTRAADVATMPTGPWYAAASGSLAVDAMWGIVPPTNFPRFAEMSDGTTANFFSVITSPPNAVNSQMQISGVAQTQAAIAYSPVAGTAYRAAGTYSATAHQITVAGLAPVSAANTTPSVWTTLSIGNRPAADRALNGYVRRIRYWPRVLSNTELQQVTT